MLEHERQWVSFYCHIDQVNWHHVKWHSFLPSLSSSPRYATILAFDVKVERDAQELADSLHVKIFQADIIYHLFDKFMAYRDELKQKKRDEFKSIAVFPCKIKVIDCGCVYLCVPIGLQGGGSFTVVGFVWWVLNYQAMRYSLLLLLNQFNAW